MRTYKIRTQVVRSEGREYQQHSVAIPPEIAKPLIEAGFRMRVVVMDDHIAMFPVLPEMEQPTDDGEKARSLVERITSGQGG